MASSNSLMYLEKDMETRYHLVLYHCPLESQQKQPYIAYLLTIPNTEDVHNFIIHTIIQQF